MKTDKKIFIAFLLNLVFSILEFFGGIFTGSIAIISDAVHDFGDAASIGASYLLERKSKKQPNEKYTYGYARFSVLGGVITTVILLVGSGVVIYNAVQRFINPVPLDYNGMLIVAGVGFIVNLLATYFTHGGHSINQKAVNLHMLEDVLGWAVILIGALVMRFTNFYILDPIMSILVAVFILFNAVKNLKEILDIFLIKTPKQVCLDELKSHILHVDGVADVHHFHIWTTDGESLYATLHVVAKDYCPEIKKGVKAELFEHGIAHVTVEMETTDEDCGEKVCVTPEREGGHHCHHGHGHHGHSHSHHGHHH
jgi:cobalt-zinc-cadmium efflux system protein